MRNAPAPNKELKITGADQCVRGEEEAPKGKMQRGRRIPPIIATTRRLSG
jgi:hypothetical protein